MTESTKDDSAAKGNPAAVGFAAFGVTTLLLQFHNLGWCSRGPVLVMALAFGGMTQLVAGFQCFKDGETFAGSAFSAYGSFWIALGLIFFLDEVGLHGSNAQDIGWFMVVWTVFTAIMWMGAIRIHSALAWTFSTLLAGFVLNVLAHLLAPAFTPVAALILIVCALLALYNMSHIVLADVFEKEVLPVGRPWLR